MKREFENMVLLSLGKLLQILTVLVMFIVIFLDPIRGRLFEWGWLQSLAMILCMLAFAFCVWLEGFLKTIKYLLD